MDMEKNLAAFNPILDENGKPKVFYHGTNKEDFSQFKLPGRKGSGGNAIFVSEDPETASYFTHKAPRSRIYPVYVSADNLFDHTNPEHVSKLSQFLTKNHNKLFPGSLYGPEASAKWAEQGDYGILEHPEVSKWMKKQGHDGFYVREGVGRPQNIALFNPSNIKSAISNTGEYDKTNPDITKAEGGAVDLSQYQDKTGFGLYSHAAETAAALPQAKGTPQQFKSMLMKQGVKPAEIEHSNYDDVFANRPSVTKDELVQHFRQSMPTIKEHVLGAKTLEKRKEELEALGENRSLREENELSDIYNGDWVAGDYPHDKAATKFESYSMPGGENYRELLLQLERNEGNHERRAGDVYREKSALVDQYDKLPPGDPRGPEISQQIVALQREYNQLLEKANNAQQSEFRSGHWDQPDVLAHLRMKDRTGSNGEKILHVDEIQSDWGQSGRGKSFQDPKAFDRYDNYINSLREKLKQENIKIVKEHAAQEGVPAERLETIIKPVLDGIDKMQPHKVASALGLEDEFAQKHDEFLKATKGVPHGPYVTNTAAWTDLALKRALHEAAKGGYDKMVITPGEEHVERYDLSNHIGEIEARPLSPGQVRLIARSKDDGEIVHEDTHDINKIDDVIGKELADKVRKQVQWPEEYDGYVIRNRKSGFKTAVTRSLDRAKEVFEQYPETLKPDLEIAPAKGKTKAENALLSGVDLKIGGEGMRHFYDRLVPKQLNELVKRHDPQVKVGRDTLETPEGPKDVHAIDITPKLREGILRGQRAFADGGAVDDEGITAYHGSPHDFDKFDISKIGTGEGAQAFGHGLYFAQNEDVARGYRDRLAPNANVQMGGKPLSKADLKNLAMDLDIPLSGQAAAAMYDRLHKSDSVEHYLSKLNEIDMDGLRSSFPSVAKDVEAEYALISHLHRNNLDIDRPNKGKMYEVHINAHPDHFLDWDMPITQQKHVIDAIDQHIGDPEIVLNRLIGHENGTGQDLYNALGGKYKAEAVSKKLHEMGIKGIKYFDAGSRGNVGDPDAIKRNLENAKAKLSEWENSDHPNAAGQRSMYENEIKNHEANLKKALENPPSRNYVVFDDKLVNVRRKYAKGGEVPEYPLAENTEDHLTYMSPDEFLEQTRPLKDTEENKRTIDTFEKGMKQGHKLDPLALYPDNQENGRHRATAAKRLGIKKVPVHNYRKGKKKGGVVDRALMIVSCQPKGSGDAR